MLKQEEKQSNNMPFTESGLLNPLCSRRQVLKLGGISVIGISALAPIFANADEKPLIIMERATGIIVADPIRCVGCGRCELACTEFNDGRAAPSLSRIKIDRNLSFGPSGKPAIRDGKGNWGDGLIVQDICKQCPHPVPCANICPENAIIVAKEGRARMVDLQKCTGCKLCLKACPWEMISFDPVSRKAAKCHLCEGKPKCVEACPAEALSYMAWSDLTASSPHRIIQAAWLSEEREASCQACHMPGQQKNIRQGFSLFTGASQGYRKTSSQNSGLGWIDIGGSFLVALGTVFVGLHAFMRRVTKK